MHELSIAEAIAAKVRDRALGRPVAAVVIRVGAFRQVVPAALESCWSMIMPGCRLVVEEVPATVRCRDCAATTVLQLPIPLCASCEGADVTLLTGRELVVVSLELAEA